MCMSITSYRVTLFVIKQLKAVKHTTIKCHLRMKNEKLKITLRSKKGDNYCASSEDVGNKQASFITVHSVVYVVT